LRIAWSTDQTLIYNTISFAVESPVCCDTFLTSSDMFCYRIRKYIGAYYVVLGHTDAILISGGIGEHSSAVREHVFGNLECLGVLLDKEANKKATGDESVIITKPESKVKVLVIPADEEHEMALQAQSLMRQTWKPRK
jgi:acetate kinase